MFQGIGSALRIHWRQPGFTLVAILMLAIGIGANTAVFSVANAVVLRSLPYPEPGRLTAIFENRPHENVDNNVVSLADFLDWREQNSAFTSMAAWYGATFNHTGSGEPEQLMGAVASAGFFQVFGVRPMLGDGFEPGDESQRRGRVVVVSYGFWQRRLGSDRAVVGRTITLDGAPHTMVGVMPPQFVAPIRTAEVFAPMQIDAGSRNVRGNHSLWVIARLKPGIAIAQARRDMDVISKRLEAAYSVNRGHYANVVPLDEAQRGKLGEAMTVLLVTVGVVLVIACFNVANLLLARSVTRRREIAIRFALGAGRLRIIRQLLGESFTLAAAGAAMGILLALWGVDYLKTRVPVQLGIAAGDIRVDSTVLLFAVAVAIASALLFGLAPALTAAGGRVHEVLRSGTRQTQSAWRQWQRAAIVVGEMALSVILLIGAGLLIRSFVKLTAVDPGFRAEKLLTMSFALPDSTYRQDARKTALQKALLERVSRLPEVTRAGITSFLPVADQNSRMGFVVENIDPDPDEPRRANWRLVSPGYFETMQIPLVGGRFFENRDERGASLVMIVNETAAKKYWHGRDPVGTRARLSGMEPWCTIVGVVGDVRHWGLDEPARPEAYLSMWQAASWMNNLVVRTQGDPMALAAEVRRQLWGIDKDLPPAAIRSMEDVIAESMAPRRFYMALLTGFAAIALLLAAAGIYAQLSYAVSRRAQEIGVRMALGAQRGDILRLILGGGMALSLIGGAIGVGASFWLASLLRGMLFGVDPLDTPTLVGAPALLLSIAAAACLIPSWRAARAHPANALRYE